MGKKLAANNHKISLNLKIFRRHTKTLKIFQFNLNFFLTI